MDILTEKSKRNYEYTSRYASLPYYYNKEDKKYMYGIGYNLITETESSVYYIKDTDTLESIALEKYGNPTLFWVIADYNRIRDPYIKLIDYYNFLYIPTLSGIRWK